MLRPRPFRQSIDAFFSTQESSKAEDALAAAPAGDPAAVKLAKEMVPHLTPDLYDVSAIDG